MPLPLRPLLRCPSRLAHEGYGMALFAAWMQPCAVTQLLVLEVALELREEARTLRFGESIFQAFELEQARRRVA